MLTLTEQDPETVVANVRPKLFLVDDHFLIIETLSVLLAPEFDIVGWATNSASLVDELVRLNPDAVILDVTMPGTSGIDMARNILNRIPKAKIVFLTMHKNRQLLREAFRAGASAYVVKDGRGRDLVEALKTALAGGSYVSRELETRMIQSEEEDLSERQVSVLRLIADGLSAKQIAVALNISPRTAEFHKNSIMDKLKRRTTAQLTRYAVDCGLSS